MLHHHARLSVFVAVWREICGVRRVRDDGKFFSCYQQHCTYWVHVTLLCYPSQDLNTAADAESCNTDEHTRLLLALHSLGTTSTYNCS
jgi:hypothetical protein